VAAATEAGIFHSLHTPAFGGLGVGLAKVAIGGHLGLNVDLGAVPGAADMSPLELLFSESNSRFIATVARDRQDELASLLEQVPHACIGRVTLDPVLVLRQGSGRELARLSVDDLTEAYTKTLDQM
jgi:phosphoribosylformylglycinamidine synthase